MLMVQGEFHAARSSVEQALLLCRQSGDLMGIGGSLQLLAYVAHYQGDDVEARALCAEALALLREVGARRGIAQTLVGQGWAAFGLGDYPAACASFAESLRLLSELGDKYYIAWVLEGFACVAVAQGQPVAAARLFGAATALRDAIGGPRSPAIDTDVEPRIAATRAQLDEAVFAAAWVEGTAMTPEQAIAATEHVQLGQQAETAPPALASPAEAPVVPPRAPATPPAAGFPAGLTAREVEVLRLVAQGLTDAQVADTLVVSTRTINSHLYSIYSKLGVSSRTAATRFALDHHLA
jgi:ATP/maltotriose-dependent transcriptional regulator MalT